MLKCSPTLTFSIIFSSEVNTKCKMLSPLVGSMTCCCIKLASIKSKNNLSCSLSPSECSQSTMVVEVPHNQGGLLICPFQQFVHSLIGFFGGIWHPVANSHKQLRLFKLNFKPDAPLESLITHIPSLHCIKTALDI